jgi:hypothetical protein
MKPSSGTIPDEIAVIKAENTKVPVGCAWDISWSSYDDDDEEEGDGTTRIEVTPAFIADAASVKSIATGKRWAARGNHNFTPAVETKKNVPIKNVVVCSLEHRGNGGAAYKVIADGVYVDCREDVIMDAILQEGIQKGGVLGGEYIWVKLGAHSRLIRVGSALHDKVKIIVTRKQLPVLKAKDLVVGNIYATKKDERALFLGVVNTTTIEVVREAFEFKEAKIDEQLLFVRIPEYGEKNVRKFIATASEAADKNQWRNIISWTTLVREKNHKYVEAIDKMDPEGIIEMLRTKARSEIREAFSNLASGKGKQGWEYNKYHLSYDIARNSTVANMYDVKGAVIAPFDYEPLLNFI